MELLLGGVEMVLGLFELLLWGGEASEVSEARDACRGGLGGAEGPGDEEPGEEGAGDEGETGGMGELDGGGGGRDLTELGGTRMGGTGEGVGEIFSPRPRGGGNGRPLVGGKGLDI